MTATTLDPADTGEIPAGHATKNMAPFIAGLGPALRRPTAEHQLLKPVGILKPENTAEAERAAADTAIIAVPPTAAERGWIRSLLYRGRRRYVSPTRQRVRDMLLTAAVIFVGEAVGLAIVLAVWS